MFLESRVLVLGRIQVPENARHMIRGPEYASLYIVVAAFSNDCGYSLVVPPCLESPDSILSSCSFVLLHDQVLVFCIGCRNPDD